MVSTVADVKGQTSCAELCRGVYPRLVGCLSLHLGDLGTAEEIAQDALSRVVERWDQVQSMECPEAWVFRVGFNLANSRIRRKVAERRAYDRFAINVRTSGSQRPDDADRVAVRAALKSLPPRQREAVVLRYYVDLSVAQISVAMDCRPGTVKAHLNKAIAHLRGAGLTPEHDESADQTLHMPTRLGRTTGD